jgi:DNA-binding CsgD family transcriptional regulator
MRRDEDGFLPSLFSSSEWRQITKALQLSGRQSEVADLVVRGLRDKEIMARLKMKKPTVRQHVKDIFGRVGANHRMEVSYCVFAMFRRISSDDKGHHK